MGSTFVLDGPTCHPQFHFLLFSVLLSSPDAAPGAPGAMAELTWELGPLARLASGHPAAVPGLPLARPPRLGTRPPGRPAGSHGRAHAELAQVLGLGLVMPWGGGLTPREEVTATMRGSHRCRGRSRPRTKPEVTLLVNHCHPTPSHRF